MSASESTVESSGIPSHPLNESAAVTPHKGEPPGFIRRWVRRILFFGYIFLSTLLCLVITYFVPTEGGVLTRYLPDETLVFFHVRSGDDVWRSLESHHGALKIWNNAEFQSRVKWKDELQDARDNIRKEFLLRQFFSLDREGLRFLLGGEFAFAVLHSDSKQKKQSSNSFEELELVSSKRSGKRKRKRKKFKKPSSLLFIRVQGGYGTLIRMLMAVAPQKKGNSYTDLGGGLLAFGFENARPIWNATSPVKPDVNRNRNDEVKIVILPKAIKLLALKNSFSIAYLIDRTPSWADVFGIKELPEELRIVFRAQAEGGIIGAGKWVGKLPVYDPIEQEINTSTIQVGDPLLEIRIPVSMRAAFSKHVISQVSRSEKKQRRWQAKFNRLDDAGIDLDRELWPATGKTIELKILAPMEDSTTRQGQILFSLPLRPDLDARYALAELIRVQWKGLYDRKAPKKSKKPYVIRHSTGSIERYQFVKSLFSRPMWVVSESSLMFISNAVPLGLRPEIRETSMLEKNGIDGKDLFYIKLDGVKFAEQAAVITQLVLDGERNDIGAARYMEAVTDQDALLELSRLFSRVIGKFEVGVKRTTSEGKGRDGTIRLLWQPGSAEDLDGNADEVLEGQ